MTPRIDVEHFLRRIRELPAGELTKAQLFKPEFRLHQEPGFSVYYAPFDYIHRPARVAPVGIIPGWHAREADRADDHARGLAAPPPPSGRRLRCDTSQQHPDDPTQRLLDLEIYETQLGRALVEACAEPGSER